MTENKFYKYIKRKIYSFKEQKRLNFKSLSLSERFNLIKKLISRENPEFRMQKIDKRH